MVGIVVVNVVVVGYGKVGKDMVEYMKTVPHLVRIAGIVEPQRENYLSALNTGLFVYSGIEDALRGIPLHLVPNLAIDCSSIGQGARNLETYRQYAIPAILQGGENQDVAPLYIPGKMNGYDTVRIPKCSATITNLVLIALLKQGITPEYVEADFYKTMPEVQEGKDWYEPTYKSAREVEQTWESIAENHLKIGGISSRYLPGVPNGKPMYSGDIYAIIKGVSTEDVLAALRNYEGVSVVSSSDLNHMPKLLINTPSIRFGEYEIPSSYSGTPVIPVICRESICNIPGTDVFKIHVEAVAPPIDLPLNLMAVLEITSHSKKSK